jgi:hypothetical protein
MRCRTGRFHLHDLASLVPRPAGRGILAACILCLIHTQSACVSPIALRPDGIAIGLFRLRTPEVEVVSGNPSTVRSCAGKGCGLFFGPETFAVGLFEWEILRVTPTTEGVELASQWVHASTGTYAELAATKGEPQS